MKIILDLCDKETKVQIAINSSCEENMKTGDLIKFLILMRRIYNDAKNKFKHKNGQQEKFIAYF